MIFMDYVSFREGNIYHLELGSLFAQRSVAWPVCVKLFHSLCLRP